MINIKKNYAIFARQLKRYILSMILAFPLILEPQDSNEQSLNYMQNKTTSEKNLKAHESYVGSQGEINYPRIKEPQKRYHFHIREAPNQLHNKCDYTKQNSKTSNAAEQKNQQSYSNEFESAFAPNHNNKISGSGIKVDPNTVEPCLLKFLERPYRPLRPKHITVSGQGAQLDHEAGRRYPSGIFSMMNGKFDQNARVGFYKENKHLVGFAGGACDNPHMYQDKMSFIDQCNNGKLTRGYYHSSGGAMHDLFEFAIENHEICFPTSLDIACDIKDFLQLNPNATVHLIAYGPGCVDVKNALLVLSEEERQQITVLAIAPITYIGKNLCKKVEHFVSKKDYTASSFMKKFPVHDVNWLEPHPDAGFNDCEFLSPTYRPIIAQKCLGLI